MFDSVVECAVKRKITGGAIAARISMILLDLAVAVLVTLAIVIESSLVAVVFVGLIISIALTIMVFRNSIVEYEYNYFDDKLRVDKIMHASNRRRLNTFNVGKMEILAPADSSRFGGGVNNREKYDFSTHDDTMRAYILVAIDEDNNICELKFSPNEQLLAAIKRMHSRNVFED